MNKILITVKVPIIEKEYDIYIPVSKNIKVAKELIMDTVCELSEGHFPKKEKCVLLLKDGTILKNNKIVKECGLRNADYIVLL